ncbi:MAG: aminotransferase class I/II-fold pyridoxal phosphate-dependent enzyme [Bacteroidales bacterium]|jgi:dTDP-4-amino-4,6-dideoxygalactose transaminase|nr:aminotransferase class I/II-fold pyridoxal phosphate-dependent enzyme [Bacteroidales bacterium]
MTGKNKRIYLSSPHMSGREMAYINEAFDTNWIAPLGPNVNNFETDLVRYTGCGHVAALSSGTAAIHLAIILLGVGPGDEVIVPSFTFSATVNPVVYQHAIPVFVDSEKETWNMDPELLEKAIKDKRQRAKNKSVKAIIVVHLYGMPANMDDIMAVAEKYGIPVIEDAAEALGSKYNGKSLGSFGDFGVFSFNGNKIITTSGGGALASDNEAMIDKARFLATQARDKAPHYQHSHIGYNYRMSNVLAGIGRGQMEVLDERIQQRRANYDFYLKSFSSYQGIEFLKEPSDAYFSNRWLTTVIIDANKTGINRERLQVELEKENIETRPLWKPMHLQPVFSSYPAYLNGVSESLFNTGLCLPSGSNMTEEQKCFVVEAIQKRIN